MNVKRLLTNFQDRFKISAIKILCFNKLNSFGILFYSHRFWTGRFYLVRRRKIRCFGRKRRDRRRWFFLVFTQSLDDFEIVHRRIRIVTFLRFQLFIEQNFFDFDGQRVEFFQIGNFFREILMSFLETGSIFYENEKVNFGSVEISFFDFFVQRFSSKFVASNPKFAKTVESICRRATLNIDRWFLWFFLEEKKIRSFFFSFRRRKIVWDRKIVEYRRK